MGFLGRPTDKKTLLDYQRDLWGISTGETCVIELQGLPARVLGLHATADHFKRSE
jgi:hypothetical protein